MAMHSYMRTGPSQSQTQASSLSPDEMNGFLKDKQAWEHAISLYQGPDPLDHWYNYICWYENHAHSDPELKFRETLERCLTEYEHSDYYRQDARMVRLWLKYIAMQTDPLHFYQVLFQRGTGRQVAAFYIGWASYYESREEFKDAEAVFNLAFQEKAQSNAELQHAHTKFTYARSLHYQRQQQQQAQQQAQQPQPDALQQLANYTQQLPQSYPPRPQPYQQPQQPQHASVYQQQYPPQQPPPPPPAHSQEQAAAYQTHYQDQPRYEQQQQQQQPEYAPQAHFQPPTQEQALPQETQPQQQQAAHQPEPQPQHNGNGSTSNAEAETPSPSPANSEVAGLRLPRNFHPYGRNNHETWKPALTLEEPDDPSRVCHYAKQLVYPPGAGIEYSPEEILARKYKQMLEGKQKPTAQQVQQQQQQEQQELDQQEQQTLYDSYESEASYYMTAVDGALYGHNRGDTSAAAAEKVAVEDAGEIPEEEEADDDEDDEGEQEGEEEEDTDSDQEAEEDDDEEVDEDNQTERYTNGGVQFSAQTTFEQENRSIKIKFKKERTLESSSTYSAYTIENIYHHQQHQQQQEQQQHQQQQHHHQQQQHPQQPHVPLEPQPACSPIPAATATASIQRQRNGGHHFHPYLLGQTSTPKSEANGYRRARTKVKRNKFQPDLCSNSNSSSAADVVGVAASANAASAAVAAASGAVDAATASASAALPIHNATFNDNANFSFSSATGLDNSNSSLALAVDRLHFRDTSQANATGNKTLQTHNNNNYNTNNNGNATTALTDFSTFQENSYFATQHDTEAQERRLSKAVETIARHLAKEAIDPFNSELCRAFLTKLNFPGDDDDHASYKIVQTPLPKISNTRTLNVLEGVQFNIDKEVGRGSYGSVYKATDSRTGNVVALKYQKPPNTWEIYICDQVLKRITEPEVLPGLMDISTAIIAPNASLIATEFSPFGSLLDINNKIRQATTKVMHESLVMHFSAQICNIVDHLHRQHIVHADIKPDNFLLMRVPSVDSPLPSLRLIDFGCAIDMSLFPDGEHTKFRKVVQTDGFTCIEMQEGRPWSYETDLFCIAATVHVMLFGEYMQPQKRGTTWDIRQKLPRYLKKHVWSKFFGELLNMQADKLPALREMRDIIEEECYRMDSELQKQIRTLSNILHRR
ncbi:putative mediator of RNA polymerase II transcription subunit 26 isoform X1 [Drosophila obscura]|uniref:putative mediator of RNA polymerase II transcription subunit 26 isoform X1 n=1 Tax=Drosophila obscura TaxID=7282 RepID=UPI001BB20E78|nr:putative mediator of RNA polymerase II transcription subunit 26 isoform X1 [Drosophila obscura]